MTLDKRRLTKRRLTEIYNEMSSVLEFHAGSFTRTTEFPFGDLYGEACWIFLRVMIDDDHDPKRSSLRTWVSRRVRNGLCDFIKEERRLRSLFTKEEIEFDLIPQPHLNLVPSKALEVRELIDSLSPDAQRMVRLALQYVQDPRACPIRPRNGAPRHVRGAIVRRVRRDGLTWPRIWEALAELRITFSGETR